MSLLFGVLVFTSGIVIPLEISLRSVPEVWPRPSRNEDLTAAEPTRRGKKIPPELAHWLVEQEDREKFVMPAPAGYVPTVSGSSIAIVLSLPGGVYPGHGVLGYRLSIRNTGSERILLGELGGSFFKLATYPEFDDFTFEAVRPDGSVAAINGFTDIRLPEADWYRPVNLPPRWQALSEAELTDYMGWRRVLGISRKLWLDLLPGETFVAPGLSDGNIRPLFVGETFSSPGTYLLRLVIDRHNLGLPSSVTSNWVRVDVGR